METRECECGKSFVPSGRGKAQRFCSVKCRMRAYRRRAAEKRNVTVDSATQKTIASLRRENARLRRELERTQERLAKSEVVKKTRNPEIREKTRSKPSPCPICGKPVKLIITPMGLIVPRHREQFGQKICKGTNTHVSEEELGKS